MFDRCQPPCDHPITIARNIQGGWRGFSILHIRLCSDIGLRIEDCPVVLTISCSERGRALPDVDVRGAPTLADHIRLVIDRGAVTGEEAGVP